MTTPKSDELITIQLTPEQYRYVVTSLNRMSRSDRRGAEKIERKFQQPVKDAGLLRRLKLAKECLAVFSMEHT